MAMSTQPTRVPFGAITVHQITTAVLDAYERVVTWNDARKTLARLEGLDARQLEDIGLTRGDLNAFSAKTRLF